jgi:hypothetical protein
VSIFKVYNFISKIKDSSVINNSEFRQKFFDSYEQELAIVVDYYKQTINKRP